MNTSESLLVDYGAALCRQRRVAEAEAVLQYVLNTAAAPGPRALAKLATVRLVQGRGDDAVSLLRAALQQAPDAGLHSKLIAMMSYTPTDTAAIKSEQRRWNDVHRQVSPSRTPTRQSRSRLRVGYLAAGFGDASVLRICRSVLRHADRDQFEVHCYSGTSASDSASRGVCDAVDAWVHVGQMNDQALEATIRRDGIDILVELDGHMDGNRLPALRRRPARVQLSAWGYTPGPGLDCIDGLLADPIVVPPGERHLYPEHVFDLPCVHHYEAPTAALDPGPAPMQTNPGVTFGCLNRVEKIGPSVCRAWADILRAVPNARLVLVDAAFQHTGMPETIRGRFEQLGVEGSRLDLLPRCDFDQYLAIYRAIDIALDPWPHSGGLTTLDALWMGVPVVTLQGTHPLGRTSASILRYLDLADLVTPDVDAFVACALALAHDVDRVATLRRTLRPRVTRALIESGPAYARATEGAFREAWARYGQ